MTRCGYVLCTRRKDIQPLVDEIAFARSEIRFHERAVSAFCKSPNSANWESAPDGFDVFQNQSLIRSEFPPLDHEVQSIIHIRRGGDISGQPLGQFTLEWLRENGCRRVTGMVNSIEQCESLSIEVSGADGTSKIKVDRLVNAAGPFAAEIARMLGKELPLFNVMQQKFSFLDE